MTITDLAGRQPVVALDPQSLTDDPHPALAACRAVAPVAWAPSLGGWLVTGYDEADQVLGDAQTFTVDDPRFSTARLSGQSMLTLDGPAHRRHRAAFAAAYRPRNVAALAARIRATAQALVAARPDPSRLDVGVDLARPLAVDALAAVLELDDDLTAGLVRWHVDLVDGFAADTGGGLLPVVEQMRERVASLTRSGPSADLTDAEYVANLAIMLIGGVETVEGMIGYAARYRYGHPAGPDAPIAAVLEESLRLEPSASQLDRYVTSDVELAGAQLHRGDLVVVSVSGAQRDPRAFADPDEFVPSRWTASARRHLAFAVGPHFCLGAHLARVEATEALTAIDEVSASARVCEAESTPDVGSTFRRPGRLVLDLSPAWRARSSAR